MHISDFHLSYCSNIHPGESWGATFQNLQRYIPEIRSNLNFQQSFGIGLRLSHEASLELQKPSIIAEFKAWLESENAYVFTLNGFPYGDFHRTTVKDQVHFPDWTTEERRDYTIRSFRILAGLIPEGLDGGISTSPISYRHWFQSESDLNAAMVKASHHLLQVVEELALIERETGKFLHLDIEPEPDGILENSDEMIWLFQEYLLPIAKETWAKSRHLNEAEAEKLIRRHIQVCYDVCHFAIVYEKPFETFAKFASAGVQIGKIQISAALKLLLGDDKKLIKQKLEPFVESTYLHQVVGRYPTGELISYPDLPYALARIEAAQEEEWRIHFHVPLFIESYGDLLSTQSSIVEVLNELALNPGMTNHLEVETYTWEVLPEKMRLDMGESISRELDWVIQNMKK